MFTNLFRSSRKSRVSSVSSDASDAETLLPSSQPAPPSGSSSLSVQRTHDLRIAIKTLLICTFIYAGLALWIAYSLRKVVFVQDGEEGWDVFCMGRVSEYSPLLQAVPPNFHTVQFNGTFLHENVYRGPAGPETDAAWQALGVDYRGVSIPESEAEKTGIDHNQVRISQEYGGGYPANVEGLHHLHCLDLLRKTLKWNYDYYLEKGEGPFVNSEYIVRKHTTHCLDILRQQLMCVTDVGFLGQVWWRPENSTEPPMPFVDFNTKHRCRDYEAIRKWAEEHQLPPETEVNMSRFYEMPRPGDSILPEIP